MGVEVVHVTEELVRATLAGDAAAFQLLYRSHVGPVRNSARRISRDPELIADIVQETFARAFEDLAKLRSPDRFSAWILSISRHVGVDMIRQRDRIVLVGVSTDDDALAVAVAPMCTSPPILVELHERISAVDRSMALLSKRDALALALVAHLGYSPSEVAQILDISPGAAKVVIHRARARLRRLLDPMVERHPEAAAATIG